MAVQCSGKGPYSGGAVEIYGTMRTTGEADAMIEAIKLVRQQLSSYREAVAGDFGIEESPGPTYTEKLIAVIG